MKKKVGYIILNHSGWRNSYGHFAGELFSTKKEVEAYKFSDEIIGEVFIEE